MHLCEQYSDSFDKAHSVSLHRDHYKIMQHITHFSIRESLLICTITNALNPTTRIRKDKDCVFLGDFFWISHYLMHLCVGYTALEPKVRKGQSQASPKGRQLEVGAQRAPRILVFHKQH